MKKIILSVLIVIICILCGCKNDIYSESLKENSLQTSFEDSSELGSPELTYSYASIYGEYNNDVFINESEFESILYKCYGDSYVIFDQKSETKYKEISFNIYGEFACSAEIYYSIADAKLSYKDWFILRENNNTPLVVYLYLENVVRIGNIIIAGHENAIKPICDYYNINVETKIGTKKSEAINHVVRYSVEEIESYMSNKGYAQFDSQVNEGLTQYKVFINFEKSDIGVMIICQTAEKTKNTAEFLTQIYNDNKNYYSCMYSNNFLFLSKDDLWENTFNEMKNLAGDGSKPLKK